MPIYNHKHDFIPSRQADLLAWSRNFRDHINNPPGPAQFGLTIAQAAHYTALHDAYAASLALARDPSTNSRSNIQTKNDAKAALKAEARVLARIIRANPDVDNAQRIELGLTVPAAATPNFAPMSVSEYKPVVMVQATIGRTVRLRIRGNAMTTRRARPAGTVGAVVLSYVAPPHSPEENSPPESISKWSYCGHATRPTFQVNFGAEVPAGSKVWFVACWVNTRGSNGPFSTAVSTRIGDGLSGFMGTLRLAA
jgi:hypothetical protein